MMKMKILAVVIPPSIYHKGRSRLSGKVWFNQRHFSDSNIDCGYRVVLVTHHRVEEYLTPTEPSLPLSSLL